jgi:hypothetical protein
MGWKVGYDPTPTDSQSIVQSHYTITTITDDILQSFHLYLTPVRVRLYLCDRLMVCTLPSMSQVIELSMSMDAETGVAPDVFGI